MRLSDPPRFTPRLHINFRQHVVPEVVESTLADTIAYNLQSSLGGPDKVASLLDNWIGTGKPCGHPINSALDDAFHEAVKEIGEPLTPSTRNALRAFSLSIEKH